MKKLVVTILLIISVSFTVHAEEVIPIIDDTVHVSDAPILVAEEVPNIEVKPSLSDTATIENTSIAPHTQQIPESPVLGTPQGMSFVENTNTEKCELVNYGIDQSSVLHIISEYIKYENLFENNMNYLKVYCIPNIYLDDGREILATIPAMNPILNREEAFNLVKDYFSLTAWQGKYDVYYFKHYVRILHAK